MISGVIIVVFFPLTALPQTMEEDVEINDQVETIAVPQTDLYRKAVFKHDFDQVSTVPSRSYRISSATIHTSNDVKRFQYRYV